MLRIGVLLVASLSLSLTAAFGQPVASSRELVAVMDLESIGATKAQISACSERLREELLQGNRFRLVDRNEMAKIMDEQALQQSGCTTQECMVKVGRVLGVRKLVTGRVTKVEDDLWMVSGTLLDVESAETLRVASVQHDGNFRSLLGPGMAALAAKLQIPAGSAATMAPPPSIPAPAPARPTPVPTPAAVAQRPGPAVPGGSVGSVAIFPMLITECRDAPSTCGANLLGDQLATSVAQALASIGRTNVVSSYYPESTGGTALGLTSAAADALWSGVFSKAPDPIAVSNTAKASGAEVAVMVSARYDVATATGDLYVVDVASRRPYSQRFSIRREPSGKVNQAELNQEIATLFAAAHLRQLAAPLPAGGPRTFALLRVVSTGCRGGPNACGNSLPEQRFVEAIAAAIKGVPGLTITGSVYPDLLPGKSLRDDAELQAGSWGGFSGTSPNIAYLAQNAPRLGVNAYLGFTTRYEVDSAQFEFFIVDAAAQNTTSTKFRVGRSPAGTINQDALDREVAAAIQKFLGH